MAGDPDMERDLIPQQTEVGTTGSALRSLGRPLGRVGSVCRRIARFDQDTQFSNEGKLTMSDFTPQVETREIADADLDNVAGGVLGLDVASVAAPVLSTVDSVAPVSGTLSQVTAMLPSQATSLLGI